MKKVIIIFAFFASSFVVEARVDCFTVFNVLVNSAAVQYHENTRMCFISADCQFAGYTNFLDDVRQAIDVFDCCLDYADC